MASFLSACNSLAHRDWCVGLDPRLSLTLFSALQWLSQSDVFAIFVILTVKQIQRNTKLSLMWVLYKICVCAFWGGGERGTALIVPLCLQNTWYSKTRSIIIDDLVVKSENFVIR